MYAQTTTSQCTRKKRLLRAALAACWLLALSSVAAAQSRGTDSFTYSSYYDGLVVSAARRYGIDLQIFRALVVTESGFLPRARSPKGAQGLTQLMPATAARFGVRNPFDPAENIEGGARYLRWLLDYFGGDYALALAGYNAGEGAVVKYGRRVPPYPETRSYVSKILNTATRYRAATPGGARTAFDSRPMPLPVAATAPQAPKVQTTSRYFWN